jgi:hypothetical protein
VNNIHGEYKLALSGNIMFTVARGPWNLECVASFMQDYYAIILPLHGSRWGDLIILQGESLLIPAAEKLLAKAISISCSKGLTEVAFVLSDSTVPNSAKEQFLRVYQPSGLNVQLFQNEQTALQWLIQQGLHCDKPAILPKFA